MENENAQARVPASMSQKLAWMKAILRDKELTEGQKLVAAALMTFHNQITGQCNPSQRRIGEAVNMHRQSVNPAVKALRAGGWIRTSGEHGGTCEYVLLVNRAGIEMPAGVSARNDNSPEGGCPATQTGGVGQDGQGVSGSTDTELLSEPLSEPSMYPAPTAKAARTGTQSRASGRSGERAPVQGQAKRTPLPAEWELDDRIRSAAEQHGVRIRDVQSTFAGFLAHHRGRGTLSPDWPAMWASWCIEHVVRRNEREARNPTLKPSRYHIS